MILSLNEQAEIFITTIIAGMISTMLYDGIKIFRIAIRHKNFFIQIEDAIYWIVISIFVFNIMLDKNYGEIRLFNIIGVFLGMIFYILTISPLIIKISNKIIFFVKYILNLIFRVILTPIYILYKIFGIPVIKSGVFMAKKSKNLLHLFSFYARMKNKTFKRNMNILIKKK